MRSFPLRPFLSIESLFLDFIRWRDPSGILLSDYPFSDSSSTSEQESLKREVCLFRKLYLSRVSSYFVSFLLLSFRSETSDPDDIDWFDYFSSLILITNLLVSFSRSKKSLSSYQSFTRRFSYFLRKKVCRVFRSVNFLILLGWMFVLLGS